AGLTQLHRRFDGNFVKRVHAHLDIAKVDAGTVAFHPDLDVEIEDPLYRDHQLHYAFSLFVLPPRCATTPPIYARPTRLPCCCTKRLLQVQGRVRRRLCVTWRGSAGRAAEGAKLDGRGEHDAG